MRWLWLLLLPVVWVPLLALVALMVPYLPWYAWAFGVLFVGLWVRRRRAAASAGQVGSPADPAGPLFAPTHRSGGLW